MTDYNREEVYTPRLKYGPRFTADDVRAHRDMYGLGMMECKEILMKQQIIEDLEKGRSGLDTSLLYDILEYMVRNDYV